MPPFCGLGKERKIRLPQSIQEKTDPSMRCLMLYNPCVNSGNIFVLNTSVSSVIHGYQMIHAGKVLFAFCSIRETLSCRWPMECHSIKGYWALSEFWKRYLISLHIYMASTQVFNQVKRSMQYQVRFSPKETTRDNTDAAHEHQPGSRKLYPIQ